MPKNTITKGDEQHDIKKYEYWSSEWRIVCDRYDVCCNITRAAYDEWVSATIGDSGTHDTVRHIVLWIVCTVEGQSIDMEMNNMTGTIKQFNLAEWYVIASFSLLMGMAVTGICCILTGDPIFAIADWIGIGVLITACVVGLFVIVQHSKNGR